MTGAPGRGVDLQRAGRVGHRAGEIGGIAGAVRDGRPVEIERRHRQVGGVLRRRHRVAEGQRIGAGAAGIGGGAAVVERQRRRAAGNRHRLAQVQGQRDHLAGIEIAMPLPSMPVPDVATDATVGVVVSICGPVGLVTGERQVGGVAGAVLSCAVEIDAVAARRRCSAGATV